MVIMFKGFKYTFFIMSYILTKLSLLMAWIDKKQRKENEQPIIMNGTASKMHNSTSSKN